jgi:hypothetical protein
MRILIATNHLEEMADGAAKVVTGCHPTGARFSPCF